MRYFVKNERGEELVVPSLTDLVGLYTQGFLEDEDYVRAETSERWVKAGRMPALAGVRHRQREPARFQMLLLAAIGLVAVVVGAIERVSPLLLILVIALVSGFALARRRR
jgi:hypothetical protein